MRALGLCLAVAVTLASPACNGDKPKAKPAALLATALDAQNKGDTARAETLLKQVVAAEPNNVVAHYNLGVIYQGRGDNARALTEYGLALAANPKYVPALFNEATIWGATDPPLAVSTYRKVVALQPKAPTAYLNLGLLELGLKMEQQGLLDLTKALSQDPTLIDRLTPEVKTKLAAFKPPASASASPSPTASPS